MNTRSKLAAVALSGMVAIAPLAGSAWSTETGSAPVAGETATTAVSPSQIMKTSSEVYSALRDVRAARMAIFDGDTKAASSLVASAAKGFDAAGSQIANLGIENGKDNADSTTYVPFETALGLAEDFVPTADDTTTLQQANDHLTKGDQKQAAEVLKSADISVTVTAAMVPIDKSVARARDAETLMGQGKYYEANLALKDIEDSIMVEAYALDSIPAQGSTKS
jgi:hypothetical protein